MKLGAAKGRGSSQFDDLSRLWIWYVFERHHFIRSKERCHFSNPGCRKPPNGFLLSESTAGNVPCRVLKEYLLEIPIFSDDSVPMGEDIRSEIRAHFDTIATPTRFESAKLKFHIAVCYGLGQGTCSPGWKRTLGGLVDLKFAQVFV